MSDIKNIDELFKAKLTGAAPAAYSEAAWMSANQMLNGHFRALFLKKLVLWSLPVLLSIGIGSALYFQQLEQVNFEYVHQLGIEMRQSKKSDVEFYSTEQVTEKHYSSLAAFKVSQAFEAKPADTKATRSKQYNTTKSSGDVPQNTPELASVNNTKSNNLSKQGSNLSVSADDSDSQGLAAHSSSSNPTEALNQQGASTQMTSTEMARLRLGNSLSKLSLGRLPSVLDNYAFGLSDKNDQGAPLVNELKKLQLMAEFGVLTGPGFHDLNGNRKALGFGLHGQLLAKYHLGQSVYLDLAVGAFNRTSLTKNGSFIGQSSTQIDITPLSLNYASILVGVGYRIGARHAIGGGMQFNPLLSVLAKKEKSVAGETESTVSYINDKNGFYALDAAFVINYRIAVAERLDATAGLQLGFMDATDNSIFNSGDINDFNSLLKLGLSYRLTQR
mgnify:CR=1 FL=1|jgi:hypothetical protein